MRQAPGPGAGMERNPDDGVPQTRRACGAVLTSCSDAMTATTAASSCGVAPPVTLSIGVGELSEARTAESLTAESLTVGYSRVSWAAASCVSRAGHAERG